MNLIWLLSAIFDLLGVMGPPRLIRGGYIPCKNFAIFCNQNLVIVILLNCDRIYAYCRFRNAILLEKRHDHLRFFFVKINMYIVF